VIPAALLTCALNVSPITLEAVIRVESDGNPLALNVNHLQGPQPHPATAAEAVSLAQGYIARGYSVDIGLMQVNSRNLPVLGYTVEQVLDPCTNIRAGGTILAADYGRAAQQFGSGQPALLAALSAYNTGDFARGFANGYVARYVSVPQPIGPVIKVVSVAPLQRPTPPPNPYAADTEVRWNDALFVARN